MWLAPSVPPGQTPLRAKGAELVNQEQESESLDPPLRNDVSSAHLLDWKWPKGTLVRREGVSGPARLGSCFQSCVDIVSEQQASVFAHYPTP